MKAKNPQNERSHFGNVFPREGGDGTKHPKKVFENEKVISVSAALFSAKQFESHLIETGT